MGEYLSAIRAEFRLRIDLCPAFGTALLQMRSAFVAEFRPARQKFAALRAFDRHGFAAGAADDRVLRVVRSAFGAAVEHISAVRAESGPGRALSSALVADDHRGSRFSPQAVAAFRTERGIGGDLCIALRAGDRGRDIDILRK